MWELDLARLNMDTHGRRICEERIRAEVEPEHAGRSLVSDVTTGGYVVAWSR